MTRYPTFITEQQLVAQLRADRDAHADDPDTQRCPICDTPRCWRWRYARALLVMCDDD